MKEKYEVISLISEFRNKIENRELESEMNNL